MLRNGLLLVLSDTLETYRSQSLMTASSIGEAVAWSLVSGVSSRWGFSSPSVQYLSQLYRETLYGLRNAAWAEQSGCCLSFQGVLDGVAQLYYFPISIHGR